MEHLQEQNLNEPRESWTPWQADEEMLWSILTGQLLPPADDAPTWVDVATPTPYVPAMAA